MIVDDHLFRRESGRMIAVLTRLFGVHNLALAEDAVQDAFCRAAEVWTFRGPPDDPSAWLMAAAKNRALDILRRERTARTFAPDLSFMLESEWTLSTVVEAEFARRAIKDDLLRMMFSCCHPRLREEAQVALVLNVLCGFSVGEVASAFVRTEAAIGKRITRAKKALAASKRLFDVEAGAEITARLPAVQRALYLLFSEGYHGASPEKAVRVELCREAMRLTALLLEHATATTPTTYALAALMCLDAARLPARVDAYGDLSSLFDQDRLLWDRRLIAEGLLLLERSATGSELSEYHLEAAIAATHACARRAEDTDWAAIILGRHHIVLRRSDEVAPVTSGRAQPRHRRSAGPGPRARARGDTCHRRPRPSRRLSFPFSRARRVRVSLWAARGYRPALPLCTGPGPQPDGASIL